MTRYLDIMRSKKICRVEGCERHSHSHQVCRRHLYRLRRYGDPDYVGEDYRPINFRVAKKFKKDEDGCWLWQGYLHNGYGQISYRGFRMSAHRFSYEFFIGELKEKCQVLRTCGKRNCINPDHLELYDPSEL